MFNNYCSACRDNEEDNDNEGVPAHQAQKWAADVVLKHNKNIRSYL